MTPLVWLVVGFVAGAVITSWVARRRLAIPPVAAAPSDGPPLLDWILRANGATGAWLIGSGTREAAVTRIGIPDEMDQRVRKQLEHHRMGDGEGVERLESGTLVYASLDGRAAGLQLPPGSSTGARATALRDLKRLLDFDRWRPVVAAIAKGQESLSESVESVALRLAHQIERALGVETCVALPRTGGVEISGVSMRSDRRLLRVLVEPGSVLEQVALGLQGPRTGVVTPFGLVRADRRKRRDPAFVIPIPGEKLPAGAIAVWTDRGAEPVGAELINFRAAVEAAGPRVVAALDRRNLAEAAMRDSLTGIRNRRGFEEVMTSMAEPIGALIYADIDYFKTINDRLGHPAGDQALIYVSRILMQAVRDDDTVARIGGEEFAIWLPGASLDKGREIAERVRQAIAWSDWRWQGEKWPLSASFGVSACPETSSGRKGLPAQADAALYASKRAGRDRVSVAPPSIARGESASASESSPPTA